MIEIDFETYSEAGYLWSEEKRKFVKPPNLSKKGLSGVGAARYAQHPSTEILSLAYNLNDGTGPHVWHPELPLPFDLFEAISRGELVEAWNVSFERWIWRYVAQPKYLFPPLPESQLRDAMAKARAYSLPGKLDKAGEVLDIKHKKLKDGTRLLNKFSMPRNPTKNNPSTRVTPADDLEDAAKLYEYNIYDILAEQELSKLIPDLSPDELRFWQCDQAINIRGVQVDIDAVKAAIRLVEDTYRIKNARLSEITGGQVKFATEVPKLKAWLFTRGYNTTSLDKAALSSLLANPLLPPDVREALEIREETGSAAVKKLYALLAQTTDAGRLHDLFIYHSARTGRAAGAGVQPQNFPNSGVEVAQCSTCNTWTSNTSCCGDKTQLDEWGAEAADATINLLTSSTFEEFTYFHSNPIATLSGCLRGMLVSKPGHDLLCSDYSAIEAVVLAALAGEQWRLDVFKSHGMIYEMSASKITGVPFEEFVEHKRETGQHHPLRKKIGKVAELASGYGGSVGAWKQFGADKLMDSDDEILNAVRAWRKASPTIVRFWGGQRSYGSGSPYYGLEGCAVQAIQNPGQRFSYNGITYYLENDVMFCVLLSGRKIAYHRPRLAPHPRFDNCLEITFEGWNTNPAAGAIGWVCMGTYGGKLTENVVQATARDILAHAIIKLEDAGYPVVLHIHDEIVCEVPEGFGSVEEMERIMMDVPEWAANWGIKAAGGWRAKRYSK